MVFGIDYALAAAAAFSVLQQHHMDKPQPDLPTVHCNAQMGSDDYIYLQKFFQTHSWSQCQLSYPIWDQSDIPLCSYMSSEVASLI